MLKIKLPDETIIEAESPAEAAEMMALLSKKPNLTTHRVQEEPDDRWVDETMYDRTEIKCTKHIAERAYAALAKNATPSKVELANFLVNKTGCTLAAGTSHATRLSRAGYEFRPVRNRSY